MDVPPLINIVELAHVQLSFISLFTHHGMEGLEIPLSLIPNMTILPMHPLLILHSMAINGAPPEPPIPLKCPPLQAQAYSIED